MPKRLILASASPRRKELLALLRLPFEVIVSDVDETAKEELPHQTAERLAVSKAYAIAETLMCDASIVIGADTVVALTDEAPATVLGKPNDHEDARRMLRLLSGRTHSVFTGVSLIETDVDGDCAWRSTQTVVDTQVTFRQLTDEMIEAYIATGEPFDKAGGYGIQGYASTFVESVYGDYFNIVGLPIATVAKMLEDIGIEWWRGPAALD
jgi:septum formation protein